MALDFVVLHPGEVAYPSLLAEIHDPPTDLYCRGRLDLGDRLIIAVVGSRKATAYGREVVRRLVPPLAAAGAVIVSGLAYGIDGAAHEAALAAGGLTVAVLGTPVDRVYPAAHTALARQIVAAGGATLSEIPPGTASHKGSFPKRNRIIAGLAHATVVVEAAIDSGSLITARSALDENREVFAVPGAITSETAAGTNLLIQQGARPVMAARDILEAFHLAPPPAPAVPADPLSDMEGQVAARLSGSDPVHIDKLAESVTIDLPDLQNCLTLLELRGVIRMTSPGYYIRCS